MLFFCETWCFTILKLYMERFQSKVLQSEFQASAELAGSEGHLCGCGGGPPQELAVLMGFSTAVFDGGRPILRPWISWVGSTPGARGPLAVVAMVWAPTCQAPRGWRACQGCPCHRWGPGMSQLGACPVATWQVALGLMHSVTMQGGPRIWPRETMDLRQRPKTSATINYHHHHHHHPRRHHHHHHHDDQQQHITSHNSTATIDHGV